jgi:hypothetical protein
MMEMSKLYLMFAVSQQDTRSLSLPYSLTSKIIEKMVNTNRSHSTVHSHFRSLAIESGLDAGRVRVGSGRVGSDPDFCKFRRVRLGQEI